MSTERERKPGSGPGWVAFLVAQLGDFAAMRFAARVERLGLTPAHAGLLRAVAADPGRSQQSVSQLLGLLPSRLVALVDELEKDGLVERRRNLRDRRHYALHLTSAGQDRLREVGRVANEHGKDLLAPLEPQDRAVLGKLLGRLAAHHGLAPGVHPGYRSRGQPTVGESAKPEAG